MSVRYGGNFETSDDARTAETCTAQTEKMSEEPLNALKEKTISALEKQVELLNQGGQSCADRDVVNRSVSALSGLLYELRNVATHSDL